MVRIVDELRAAVRELATAPSAEQADVLVFALDRAPPSPELVAFITDTLELPALHEVRDSGGVPMRWRLVDRLLGLGFPHALHVTPDDLDYHRSRTHGSRVVPAVLTVAAGFVSMLWSFLWGALAVGGGVPLVFAVTVAAFAHGLLAFLSGMRAASGDDAPMLKPLGWAFFAGPLIAGFMTIVDHHAGVATFLLGMPGMLTALLCALTAAWSRPAPGNMSTHTPELEAGRAAEPVRVATR